MMPDVCGVPQWELDRSFNHEWTKERLEWDAVIAGTKARSKLFTLIRRSGETSDDILRQYSQRI